MSSSLLRYSFSVPPKLDLRVCPKLGEREVTFYHVTEWIEKKLKHEFQVKKKRRRWSCHFLSTVMSVLISSSPSSISRKSLSCQIWMTYIYPWCTQGWTVLKRSSVSHHCARALKALLQNPCREIQQSQTSASLTSGQKHKRQRRRWRICASEGEMVLSLMFTSRMIQCEYNCSQGFLRETDKATLQQMFCQDLLLEQAHFLLWTSDQPQWKTTVKTQRIYLEIKYNQVKALTIIQLL